MCDPGMCDPIPAGGLYIASELRQSTHSEPEDLVTWNIIMLVSVDISLVSFERGQQSLRQGNILKVVYSDLLLD